MSGQSNLTAKLSAIGDAIRAKTEKTGKLTLDEMATEIGNLKTSAELTFSTVRGTAPAAATATFAKPTAPTATGYTFLAWYKDASLTTEFDFAAEAETATVYAKWKINAPTVSHPDIDADGTTSYVLGTVTPAGSGQTVQYSADNKTWTSACPKQSADGTYTTYWRITATDCDPLTGSFTTTISSLKIVSWASGSDSDIEKMIAAAHAGKINLGDYWNVGDTRSVELSAMSATGVGESHVAQTVQIVITDKQGLYSYADGSGKCQIIWQLKDGLANGSTGEYGYMNSSSTNSGGWASCARRTWCNSVFYNALPSYIKNSLKKVKVITANGSGSSTSTSEDYCFLPAEKEVFASNTYGNSTAESSLKQWTYYATSSNRVKHCGPNGSANSWWERSPNSGNSSHFCGVNSDGSASWYIADSARLLAPSGCF